MHHRLLDHLPGTLAGAGTPTAQSTVEDSLRDRWIVRRKRVVLNGWAAALHSGMQ